MRSVQTTQKDRTCTQRTSRLRRANSTPSSERPLRLSIVPCSSINIHAFSPSSALSSIDEDEPAADVMQLRVEVKREGRWPMRGAKRERAPLAVSYRSSLWPSFIIIGGCPPPACRSVLPRVALVLELEPSAECSGARVQEVSLLIPSVRLLSPRLEAWGAAVGSAPPSSLRSSPILHTTSPMFAAFLTGGSAHPTSTGRRRCRPRSSIWT